MLIFDSANPGNFARVEDGAVNLHVCGRRVISMPKDMALHFVQTFGTDNTTGFRTRSDYVVLNHDDGVMSFATEHAMKLVDFIEQHCAV